METLESKLEEARKVRAAKILDGAKVDRDNAEIASLESQIQIANDVEAERVRRQRQATQEAADNVRREQQARLAALIQDDLQDSKLAQEAALILTAAFSRKLERISAMARLAADITRKPVPMCLSRPELERRLACRLSAVMRAGLPINNKQQLGALALHPGVEKAETIWRDADAATFEKHLTPILKG
jgi:hypothetical protein